MKNLIFKTKNILNLLLVIGVLLLASCNTDNKSSTNNEPVTKVQNSLVEKELLTGSWKDNSESALDFTLFEDGTARSDNMKTLLYKKWNVEGNEITFTIESIGNGTTSTGDETYSIEKLTKTDLILRKGAQLSAYTKK